MDNSTASDGLPFGAGPPPSSDYHVERSVFGWGIAMSILSATAVAARFYTRARIRHVLGVEDYFILVAFVRLFHPNPVASCEALTRNSF